MGSGPTRTTNQNQMQTQNTVSAPWAPSTDFLMQSLGLAGNAANNTYNGSSVAPLNPLVTQGQGLIQDAVAANVPGNISTDAGNYYEKLINSAGLTDPMKQALASIDQSKSYLNPYASGTYLQPGQNPYLDQVLAASGAATAAPINAAFSASGRYGSPAQAGTVATAVGNQDVAARMADYNQQQTNQLQAIRDMLGLDTAKANIGQAGVGNIGTAVSAIPTLTQGQTWAGSALQGIGADQMNYLQQVINAANQDPWTKAQNLAQIAGGIGQLGGTSTATSFGNTDQRQTTNPGIFGDIIAGVGAAANLSRISNPFSFGGATQDLFSPPTFQGSYGSPFGGLSDRRAKENIKEVGTLDNGLKLYSFSYKMGGPPQLGLMAQEVETVFPEAVWTGEDGLKRINYELVAAGMATKDKAA